MTPGTHAIGLTRANLILGLVLIIATAVAGCREMIANPSPAWPREGPHPAHRSLIILGVDGEPLGEDEVRFRAVDDRGIPLGDVELDLEDAQTGRLHNSYELRKYGRLFLPSGELPVPCPKLPGPDTASCEPGRQHRSRAV